MKSAPLPSPPEDREQRTLRELKQGRPPFTVDMKIVDDDGNEQPWDDESFGHLLVRGPGVVRGYHGRDGEPQSVLDGDGWFDTGDVATLDPQGYMQITDRSKDVIKSGGEWISSIELENLAVGHPEVAAERARQRRTLAPRPPRLRRVSELDRHGVPEDAYVGEWLVAGLLAWRLANPGRWRGRDGWWLAVLKSEQ